MREIEFRGKELQTGKWVYGYYVEDGFPYICGHNSDDFLTYYAVDPDTVGQYTGLEDENGKKIFEGDIVREHETGRIFSIVYNAPEFNFHVNNFGYVFLNHPENFEVIGNIHDNPELLDE